LFTNLEGKGGENLKKKGVNEKKRGG